MQILILHPLSSSTFYFILFDPFAALARHVAPGFVSLLQRWWRIAGRKVLLGTPLEIGSYFVIHECRAILSCNIFMTSNIFELYIPPNTFNQSST